MTRIFRSMALLGFALCAAVLSPFSAVAGPMSGPGGTITFIGRVVGPNFEVRMAPRVVKTSLITHSSERRDDGFDVTFLAPTPGVPGAVVSFHASDAVTPSVIGPDPRGDVLTHFVDPKGRALPWQSAGHYYLRPEGGVLSLSEPRRNPQALPKEITLVMSYD
jgi:hypothetical protein